ncbi:MAG: hypothetical protein VX278_22540, partial [Myxococcota bacterium]|nr:hypothetical protein [Myxococcota bacterium]
MKKSPKERISPRSAASQADSANNNQVKPQTSSHSETTAFGSFQNQLGNQALHTTIEDESHSSIGAHYLENAIFQMGGVQLESEPSNSDQI